MTTSASAVEVPVADIAALMARQRAYFESGATRSLAFRTKMLKRLRKAVKHYEPELVQALQDDFRKCAFETYLSENGMVLEELGFVLKHLPEWVGPQKVETPVTILPGTSYIHPTPYGTSLIIGAWNYPFQLVMMPLVGALAAGNTAIVKPSELSPSTAGVIARILGECFEPEYVAVVEGGVATTQALLAERFDYIFFTGSTRVGKIVAAAAAKHLTPTTLELGGKSPCIVDKDAHLDYAAKRIVWGKFLNGGQTCVAPDYLLVHEDVKEELLFKMRQYIREFYGADPQESPDYPRIINEAHFDRLVGLLGSGKAVAGGKHDRADRYIAPTLLDQVSWDSPVMEEEIFGPILPVLSFSDIGEAFAQVRRLPKPLAAYLFAERKSVQHRFVDEIDFGGGCVNDTVAHFGNPHLPFGGVGSSGSGAYHGKHTFDAFSHRKSVHNKTTWVDVPLRYPPYEGKLPLLKTIIK
jgi:aldehyde dehydrogenase (NAD+)